MIEIRNNPWEEHELGFNINESLYNETKLHRLWFEYLRLSPTFWLAHKNKKGTLSKEEHQQLPDDFDKVIETYEHFGEIYRYPFWGWWFEDGRDFFGKTGLGSKTKPQVTQIGKIQTGPAFRASQSEFSDYLNSRDPAAMRREELIYAVPLDLAQKDIIKQFTKQIATEFSKPNEPALKTDAKQRPIYKPYPQKFRYDILEKGLRLLWIMAKDPSLLLWEVGQIVNISPKHSKLVIPKKYDDYIYGNIVESLKTSTSRAERKAINVMENAARGRFPCYEKINTPKIDYKSMGERLNKRHAIDKKQNEHFKDTPKDEIGLQMYQIIYNELLEGGSTEN
jgi:hypothetical protein